MLRQSNFACTETLAVGTVYPAEIATEIVRRWESMEFSHELLPPKDELVRLIESIYQASLLREEGEPIRCRVIVAEPDDFTDDDAGPPTGFQTLRFDQPRELTPHEVRKLSAAAGYYRSLLAVSHRSGAEPGLGTESNLKVWAIICAGTRWVNRVEGGRFDGCPLPQRLVLQIEGPGHIIVACGYQRVLECSAGYLLNEGVDPFRSNWLPQRFRQARTSLLDLHSQQMKNESAVLIGDEFVKLAAQSVIRRALSLVRSRGHGGMLIYVPDDVWRRPDIGQWFRFRIAVKPKVSIGRFQTLMRTLLMRLSEIAKAQRLAVVSWEDYRNMRDAELAELDEAFVEFANLLADFMSVDGSLVIDHRFRIVGFGAEILGDSHVATVHRAFDLEANRTVAEAADASGTRHRSAYRLVSGCRDAIAIIVSQDGAIRFVAHHRDKLTYWPYLP